MMLDVKRPARTGSVPRLTADGRYRTRVTISMPGQPQKRRDFYGRTPEEAEAKRDAFLAGDEPAAAGAPGLTVEHYLRTWLTVKQHAVRAVTWRRYRQIIENNIIPRIGSLPLSRLTPSAVERMWADALSAGLAPRTAKHMRDVLRNALRGAYKDGLVPRNVAALADPPRVPRSERPVLTPEQVRTLLLLVEDDRLRALYWVTIALGMRRGELLALRWIDVDLEAATLRVSDEAAETKTEASARLVGIPAVVVAVLRDHLVRQDMERRQARDAWRDSGRVFTRTDGQPLYGTLVHREWDRWRGQIGAGRVHFHDLRHSANSLYAALGVATKARSAILGHASSRTTEDTYTHVLAAELRDAAERMSGFLEELGNADRGQLGVSAPDQPVAIIH